MSSTPTAQVPIIDFNTRDRKYLARQVVDGLQETGFLGLKNVPGVEAHRLHSLCEWFFSLPLDVKMSVARRQWNEKSPKFYRGYFPVVPYDSSHKEAFDIGVPLPEDDPDIVAGNVLYENPLWPDAEGGSDFRKEMCAYFDTMHRTTAEIMRLIAIGLDQEEHVFDFMYLDKPLSTFRLLHYPPRQGEIPDIAKSDDGKTLLCGAHTDSVLMTLLMTFSYEGLEILGVDNEWKAVKADPNLLVMNIGDMLSQFTGGRLRATPHRVVDYGIDRYSVPFFLEPNYHADIGKPPLKPETAEMEGNMKAKTDGAQPLKFGHWLIRTYNKKNYIEFKELLKQVKQL